MVYEFEGRSEKEAIDAAAEELGLERDGFDVEILESQSGGLFKKGKVRIRVHSGGGEPAPAPRRRAPAPDSAPRAPAPRAERSEESTGASSHPDRDDAGATVGSGACPVRRASSQSWQKG